MKRTLVAAAVVGVALVLSGSAQAQHYGHGNSHGSHGHYQSHHGHHYTDHGYYGGGTYVAPHAGYYAPAPYVAPTYAAPAHVAQPAYYGGSGFYAAPAYPAHHHHHRPHHLIDHLRGHGHHVPVYHH